MTYFEAVLPSGICVRLRDLKTRDKLAIESELTDATPQQRSVKAQLESLARCILAHTEKQPWVFKVDDAGKPMEGVVDTDAMLAAVPAKAWISDNPLSLRTEGTSVQDLLSFVPDFDAAWQSLNMASGFGGSTPRPLVATVLRTVSTG